MNNIKRLLSIQPYSMYDNGGGSRILRRLYEKKEGNISSLGVTYTKRNPKSGDIKEIMVEAMPLQKKWMRSFVRNGIIWLRDNYLVAFTQRKLYKEVLKNDCEVVHIIDHGNYAPAVVKNNKKVKSVPLWATFHDHFIALGGSKSNTEKLWKHADRRMVISREMGTHYQQLFGGLPYEIITDGVKEEEFSAPRKIQQNGMVTIYFAGLLHIEYLPLFRTLADTLDELSKRGRSFKLILRGTQKLDFLTNRLFEAEYLPLTLDNAVLKQELDSADILYLPIKFAIPEFSLYSLSTKMIGYLGGAGTILYHGPQDSAAYKLLQANNAAVGCTSLSVSEMANALTDIITNLNLVCSINAKTLAKEKFSMQDLQNKFWQQA